MKMGGNYKGVIEKREKRRRECITSEGWDGNCSLGLRKGENGHLSANVGFSLIIDLGFTLLPLCAFNHILGLFLFFCGGKVQHVTK